MSNKDVLFNIIVLPYRDLYYEKKYGTVVRDHQMIRALSGNARVKKIHVINRPISLYEVLLGKHGGKHEGCDKVTQWEKKSFDLLGPLKKRLWTEKCYGKYLDEIKKYINNSTDVINVILDFTPIADIDYSVFNDCVIWYDLIDNFTLHNRYSTSEKNKVLKKYKMVNQCVDIITGVSTQAIKMFDDDKKMVVHNGLLEKASDFEVSENAYEFGYIGFITDKFDLDLLRGLTEKTNHRAILYGKIHDSNIKKQLEGMKNVTVAGEFCGKDIPSIMKTFRIGLLPYKKEKSHDESPLKLYEYLNYGKPIIASTAYEVENKYIHLYKEPDLLERFILSVIGELSNAPLLTAKKIQDNLTRNDYWVNKTDEILNFACVSCELKC